ncbi:helicase C-terminal domain-containing protein [Pelotomaculum propionicicum]|uniref:3'-5' exonuclease DinG n=1 Tax=Pelotomaculum propionicicum TaxID=258475 RepID=A0A4Y7RM43_9FIRM|nr:helicase C-terminal domain-containing protein [Pelotomaculum propionicicum]TEB09891.1 putative ATP-dependent helicase DinG [Pelotomaculum propionicicum]
MIKDFVVCDLETTGLNPVNDKIIEVGLVRLAQGEIAGEYHTLVNPGVKLPLKIKRLTGINDSDLAGAPHIESVLPEILDFIGENAIAGHNIQFDLSFLSAARGVPLPNPVFDTLELARIVAPDAANFRLDSLCDTFKINQAEKHRALGDAKAAAFLLKELTGKLCEINLNTLMQLNSLLAEARSDWSGFTSELIKNRLKSFPDQKISPVSYWKRDGEKIFSKARSHCEYSGDSEKHLLKEEEVVSFFSQDGPLAAVLPAYEHRPQQVAMVSKVTQALNEEKYLLMEAGTGVGKSMAYLVPAVMWSLLSGERSLIATHTINLQEQLWIKDIPLLTEVIKAPFRAALAKGRQNYICLRRWVSVLEGFHLPEEAAFYARLLTWLTATNTGDKSELNISPVESELWLNVCGETDGCLGSRCLYQRDCFVNRARKLAEEADLIITNHSLLFSDIKVENKALPAYGPLIIDEAHHLEESATTHLGRQFSQSAACRWLGVAGKTLSKLAEKAPPADGLKWVQALKKAQETRLEAVEAVRLFFMVVWDAAVDNLSDIEKEYNRFSLRLSRLEQVYEELLASGQKCLRTLREFIDDLKTCANFMEVWSLSEDAWVGGARDAAQICSGGEVLAADFQFILEGSDPEFVYWADFEHSPRSQNRNCALIAAPINAGAILYDRLFKNKKTVILTSATLAVSGNFLHFMERNGLDYIPEERLVTALHDSPFVYDQQALLCISRDLPVQGSVNEEVYYDKLEKALFKLLETAGGRTLVLFTSHRTLREIYGRLKPGLENIDICLLGHGIDGSRTRLLDEFKKDGRTVLFGASSFWEGVDVPGDALACVVIVKLPFMSPSVPVIEARLEDLARRAKDGFRALSVPQAVIRLKQGFGRLIRSSKDRGCVVILDRRILDRSYGRQFLLSLPLKSHIRGDLDLISKKVLDWLGAGKNN